MAEIKLALTPGREIKLSFLAVINFFFFLLPCLFIVLPAHLLWHYVLNRGGSRLVQVIGRPWWGDIMPQLGRYILTRSSVAQTRIVFDRVRSYKLSHMKPDFFKKKDWLSYVEVNGTAGRWSAQPGTKRSDDEVVLYYVHGGGFVIDTGGDAQVLWMRLATEMNVKRKVQFSVFSLDYVLAPDNIYPSQLTEVLAGYHYLVNTLGISEDKICISGDSAGGNLVAAFLLHLARPNPSIKVPAALGLTPRRPGSAFLISPWVKLFSQSPSIRENVLFDFIESNAAGFAALDYIGGVDFAFGKSLSWNPYHWFVAPAPAPDPKHLPVPGAVATTAANEGRGIDLLRSPYVNPSMCTDLQWLKEAYPGGGRTLFAWGGFADRLSTAGVAPQKTVKALGVHDWILFDYALPGVYRTKSTGPDRELNWGLESLADFLQEVDVKVRKSRRAGNGTSEVEAPVVEMGTKAASKAGRRRK